MSLEAAPPRTVECETCHGDGVVSHFEHNETAPGYVNERCPECDGSGSVPVEPSDDPETYID